MATLDEYTAEKQAYTRYLHNEAGDKSGQTHELSTTPLFSLKAKHILENEHQEGISQSDGDHDATRAKKLLPQYGLLGFNLNGDDCIDENEPIMLNTNAPNSIFICGSQGSGKSYTLSTVLENLLRPDIAPGKAGDAVTGVVFHYDIDSSGSVAEAAHLASLGIKVQVLVSKSNEYNLRVAYFKELKGCRNLSVQPLELRSRDLSIERMNKLMAFSEQEGRVPLYMEVIQRILREMAIESEGAEFNYKNFRKRLDVESERFTREQANPMSLRLALLESFMVENARKSKDKTSLLNLQPGTLTIIDLSDPFVDASTVCVLFDICLSLIKENAPSSGLVVALDEAHKYMNKSLTATNFTDRLLTTIREQRHNGIRVIICTQEPTLSDKLLDLCSVTIVHRFTSPAWFDVIKAHIGGASSYAADKQAQQQLMLDIMGLQTGQSFVFSPSSYLWTFGGVPPMLREAKVLMKTRLRIGDDGGKSKMARSEEKEAADGRSKTVVNGVKTNGVNGVSGTNRDVKNGVNGTSGGSNNGVNGTNRDVKNGVSGTNRDGIDGIANGLAKSHVSGGLAGSRWAK